MHEENILNNLNNITHNPFLIFANQVESKPDNTFKALKFIAKEKNVTAGRISEYLDIKPSSVTQIIKKLEEAGTAERIKSKEDARVTLVSITEKGLASLETKSEISTSLRAELFKEFTEAELAQFDDYLGRVTASLFSETFQKQIEELFAKDKHWQRIEQMSAHIGRAREQMMDQEELRRRPGGFGRRGNGFEPNQQRGFDGWKRGPKI